METSEQKMNIAKEWNKFFTNEQEKDYYKNLQNFISEEENNGKIILPKYENRLNALSISPEKTNVIILGQDPYHGENQAHGFSFSVERGIKLPPSLKNIFKEIEQEFQISMSKKNGNLIPWVDQGVMLLNSILSVEKSKPGSHQNRGWETFTNEIISEISKKYSDKVFLLWGNYSIKKRLLIDEKKHLVLMSPHPSPFSAHTGFFGNNHFKIANEFLISRGKNPINWQIND
jgi:uracil-DNA glycosylase